MGLGLLQKFGRKKPLHVIKAQEEEGELEAELGLFDLLCIGIGCTVGSGVFVLTGANLLVSGPASVICWFLAGSVCACSGLSYMELSARIPTKGSCYIYTYNALGEFMGVMGAACLTLEYGISGAGVARSWSPKMLALINEWRNCTEDCDKGFRFEYYDLGPDDPDAYFDLLGFICHGVCVIVTLVGLNMGKFLINSFTMAKVSLVCFMIVVGFAAWTTEKGYGSSIFDSMDTFAPYGIKGILLGTTKLFFGYIGFDEVACLAGRAKEPEKIMPWAIGGTLLGATILSSTAQFALGGVYNPLLDPTNEPSFEAGFEYVGWKWANIIVHYGETLLMPIVVLLTFIAQPELNYALAEDGMLPASFTKSNSRNVLTINTIASGIFLTIIAGAVPFDILWDMISLGVLVSFNLTNTSLMALRHDPDLSLPFVGILSLQWVSSCASAFMLWVGYYSDYFDDSTPEPSTVAWMVVGWILFVVHMSLSVVIFIKFPRVPDPDYSGFTAPLCPFLPTLAIWLNFFLCSQIEWLNIVYLLAWIAACLILYLVYGLRNSARDFDSEYDSKISDGSGRRHSSMIHTYVDGTPSSSARRKSTMPVGDMSSVELDNNKAKV